MTIGQTQPCLFDRARSDAAVGENDIITGLGLDRLIAAAAENRVTPFELALGMRLLEAHSAQRTRSEQRKLAASVLRIPGDATDRLFGWYVAEAARLGLDPVCLAVADQLPKRRATRRRPGPTVDHLSDTIKTAAYQAETAKGKRRSQAAQDAGIRLGLGDSRSLIQKAERRFFKFGTKTIRLFGDRNKALDFVARLLFEHQEALDRIEKEMAAEQKAAVERRRSERHVRPISARRQEACFPLEPRS